MEDFRSQLGLARKSRPDLLDLSVATPNLEAERDLDRPSTLSVQAAGDDPGAAMPVEAQPSPMSNRFL